MQFLTLLDKHNLVKLQISAFTPQQYEHLPNYINASYIVNPFSQEPPQSTNQMVPEEGEGPVIATQGPIPQSFANFWRMAWDHKIESIVMLTALVENGKRKCDPYYPDKDRPLLIIENSDFEIRLKSCSMVEGALLIRRELELSKQGISETRIIEHFQMPDWPDNSSPIDPKRFVKWVSKLANLQQLKKGTIVHCSAGVGRTGTFLALYYLLC